jgi:hypothetical protein
MTAKDKRIELELKLTRYRELGRQVYDPRTIRCIDGLIVEFEQKLREMDE